MVKSGQVTPTASPSACRQTSMFMGTSPLRRERIVSQRSSPTNGKYWLSRALEPLLEGGRTGNEENVNAAPPSPHRNRGSPMALHQTALVCDRLVAARPELAANGAVEIATIRTTGDRVQDRLLAEIGGKGLFVKEIEEALIAGHIDLAVHSLKDLETWLPAGLAIACVLPRDDPRDAFLSTSAASLAALPKGARVGTASLRRQAQLLRRRPDLTILPIRGNVNTRMRKLDAGEIDALVLALCGLERLGKAELATEILSREIMLPAVGQGALALECRGAGGAVRE